MIVIRALQDMITSHSHLSHLPLVKIEIIKFVLKINFVNMLESLQQKKNFFKDDKRKLDVHSDKKKKERNVLNEKYIRTFSKVELRISIDHAL